MLYRIKWRVSGVWKRGDVSDLSKCRLGRMVRLHIKVGYNIGRYCFPCNFWLSKMFQAVEQGLGGGIEILFVLLMLFLIVSAPSNNLYMYLFNSFQTLKFRFIKLMTTAAKNILHRCCCFFDLLLLQSPENNARCWKHNTQ